MKSQKVIIQIKAAEQYFSVVLFIVLYTVVLTVESVNEVLKCENRIHYFEIGCKKDLIYFYYR